MLAVGFPTAKLPFFIFDLKFITNFCIFVKKLLSQIISYYSLLL